MSMLKNLVKDLLRAPVSAARARREQRALPALAPAMEAYNDNQYAKVVELCAAVIIAVPGSAQAHHLQGRALIELGTREAARAPLEKAIRLDPDLAEAHADLALVLSGVNEHELAEESCRRAVALQPMEVRYRLRLVEILEAAGRERDALAELANAQECAPEQTDLLVRVCRGLDRLERYPEMLRIAERAIAEIGENAETLSCLAIARHGVDDMVGAVEACRKTIAIRSDLGEVYITLGSALFELGKIDEALAAHNRALKLNSSLVIAEYDIGLIQLMRGRFREGWQGFDCRLRLVQKQSWRRPCTPSWNGSTLRGRSLLVMREQGLGDEIMYASCYPDVIRQAAHCYIECDPRLERLFTRSFPGARFFPMRNLLTSEQTDPGAPVEVRSYAGSLPRYLRSSIRDFPDHHDYLHADPQRIEYWRSRLAVLGTGLKVGISWRGGTAVTRRVRRSLTLADLEPLLVVAGVNWVNLQYGQRAEEIAAFESTHGIPIADWPEAIDGDYDETAALVRALDLVISVCTSVVHLAGALGNPVWVMVPHVPEWRYGLHGESMPWYPSAKLFRQTERGVWEPVIDRVANELAQRAATNGI